jgi:hypothetical protein
VRRPDFFIVGAPKSGTTAMYDYLRQHPDIFMPEVKEPHFFATDLASPHYIRDESKYLSLFSKAKDEKRAGEASIWYLYSKRAAQEIKDFSTSASIIIMLRSPADMLYSLHSQYLYSGNEEIADFEAALNAEDDRKRGLRVPASPYPVEILFYREIVRYREQVERYLNRFGADHVRVIIFDDFKSELARVYRETCEFLCVSTQFVPEFNILNPNKSVRSRTVRDFMRDLSPTALEIGRALIPSNVRNRLRRLNMRYERRPPMPAELRRRLNKEFAGEVKQLGQLIGRDLSAWCEL